MVLHKTRMLSRWLGS